MHSDNRGTTLVELVISLTIFAVVITAVFGFMLAGAKSYGSVTDRLGLGLDAQLALNQLGEYSIDCNAGLYFDGEADGTLFIINATEDGGFTAHVFSYRSADGCIYYGKGSAEPDANGDYAVSAEATALLVKHVTAFSVETVSANNKQVDSVVLTLDFEKNAADAGETRTVALRNRPPVVEAYLVS